MNYPINIQGELRLSHTSASLFTPCDHVIASLLAETASGYVLDEADSYARRLADEAEVWLAYVRERSRMNDDTLVSKALSSLAFSFRHRAQSLAVPSKLVGTSKHQPVLWDLVRARTPFGTGLATEESSGQLLVSLDGESLGAVPNKHIAWFRPLVPFGARLFLVRVTGYEREGYRLGANVTFGRVGAAVASLRHALGYCTGGDGSTANSSVTLSAATVGERSPDKDPDDLLLWRDDDGVAQVKHRAGEFVHVARHSPTGLEWGYGGSGPADLALSTLNAFTDEATASLLYQRFKAEVVARIPDTGGVIYADTVHRWLASQTDA